MKDYFSRQSELYAKNRPVYPEELFRTISGLCESHESAWDCGTGNGQCAVSLSRYFKTVYATDGSPDQIANSFRKNNIIYKVEHAEHSSLPDNEADMITVATAIHWFNIPEFYREAHRTLKRGGILAVWSYAGCIVNDERIDQLIHHYAFEILKDYWPHETNLNWIDKYNTLPFPYPLITLPPFVATANQNLSGFITYINSWSAVQVYMEKHSLHPLEIIQEDLCKAWGNEEKVRSIQWELFMKCGRK